jgi:catechol 2,3-dioxygenase-like lactoylglutathione lyase family enzyme
MESDTGALIYTAASCRPMSWGSAPGLLSKQLTRHPPSEESMNWTLEVVVVPVADVDRAKAFYAERLGFNVDHDTKVSEGNRIVQLTPPGSGCSIVVGEGIVPDMPPGSLKGLQLVVADLQSARGLLVERGVEVSEIQVVGESPRPQPDPLDNVGFVFFSDPDGNAWAVQQISARG